MAIKHVLANHILIIELPAKIDTTNAQEVEAELLEILDEYPHDKLTLNAEHTTFISSMGLRVILKLKKIDDDMEIIDVKPEVYDVFEMTGFTDMIDIKKAYRVVSIEGKKLIGQGFYGKVYRLSPDTIVKVYYRGGDGSDVLAERRLAKMAFVSGIPTAISYDIVRVKEGNFLGSVFELLDSEEMVELIKKDPDNLEHYIDQYADLIKAINTSKSHDLDDVRLQAKEWLRLIKESKWLDDDFYNKIEALVNTIPESDNMVHGDCHIKNILMQNNEPLLIDMATLARGHQIFEIAPILCTYKLYEATEPGNCESFLGISAETSAKLYDGLLDRIYKDRTPEERKDIDDKILFLACVILLSRTVVYYAQGGERKNFLIKNLKELSEKLTDLNY